MTEREPSRARVSLFLRPSFPPGPCSHQAAGHPATITELFLPCKSARCKAARGRSRPIAKSHCDFLIADTRSRPLAQRLFRLSQVRTCERARGTRRGGRTTSSLDRFHRASRVDRQQSASKSSAKLSLAFAKFSNREAERRRGVEEVWKYRKDRRASHCTPSSSRPSVRSIDRLVNRYRTGRRASRDVASHISLSPMHSFAV